MRPILLTLLLLASLPTFPQTADSSQPEGTISGTVLDEHGDPFKGVTVCTYMIGAPSGSKEARGDCPVTTDQAGQFRIDHMAMGTFGVEAIKPEDGAVTCHCSGIRWSLSESRVHQSAYGNHVA
jgi:hypothetical protein